MLHSTMKEETCIILLSEAAFDNFPLYGEMPIAVCGSIAEF